MAPSEECSRQGARVFGGLHSEPLTVCVGRWQSGQLASWRRRRCRPDAGGE